jgi:hypothetical protein
MVQPSVSVVEEGWVGTLPLETQWSVSLSAAYVSSGPEAIAVLSSVSLSEGVAVGASVALDEPSMDSTRVLCGLLSESITVPQFHLLSDLLVQHRGKTTFLFPAYGRAQGTKLPTSEFLSLCITDAAECLFLFWTGGDASIGRALRHHFASPLRPMMVFHTASTDFQTAIQNFNEFLSAWTDRSAKISVHSNQNEGAYAFDETNQIIHRLVTPDQPIGQKWYNSILFKLMFDACVKERAGGNLSVQERV